MDLNGPVPFEQAVVHVNDGQGARPARVEGRVRGRAEVTRGRAWCFTANNYGDHGTIAILDEVECRYLCYGKEVCPTTGTPHLQGYVYYENARSKNAVVRQLPHCHVSAAKGDSLQNRNYCAKDGDFVEFGERPLTPRERGQLEATRWDDVWTAAQSGDILAIPSDIRIRCYSTLRRIERDYMPQVASLDAPCGTWIHGPSGCGKTLAVVSQFPGCYPKMLNKWWDGYQGEEIVYLDDVDPTCNSWLGRNLKIWSDCYAFIAENKGGSSKIRPKRFIVTSQYTIEQCFTDEETRAALSRRFRVIEKEAGQDIMI